MCGISGIYSSESLNTQDVRIVEDMLKSINHRGPDNTGVHVEENIILGHVLLAIIGLGTGKQPLSNNKNDIWVTYNGEIYNFKEIRSSLEYKGYKFNTRTDTEVLVYLYEEYGEDMVHHLNGMFAFAIWDSRAKKLFLGRDRLGVKPLFIAKDKNKFFFSSELKGLKNTSAMLGDIDPVAIMHYLRFKHVGANRSIYDNVLKVPPAHTVTIQNDEITLNKYWSPIPRNLKKDIKDEIRNVINDATKIRLVSEVPLSLALSGGIDSSIVLYESVVGCGNKVDTFSIRYPGQSEDESQLAKKLSKDFDVKHNIIDFSEIDANYLPKLTQILDEPFGDYSAYPSLMLFKGQSKFSTVVLTGDGGDEAFGGYQRYIRFNKLKNFLPVLKIINKVVPKSFHSIFPKKINNALSYGSKNLLEFYLDILSTQSESYYSSMFRSEFSSNLNFFKSKNLSKIELHDSLRNLESLIDYQDYLPGDVLSKVDLTSMHYSMEARSPFLDYRAVELGVSINNKLRIKNNKTKYLLRETYKNKIPDYILNAKKRGFTVPQAYWLTPEFVSFLKGTLLENSVLTQKIFKRNKLESFINDCLNNHNLNARHLWNVLMLELWLKQN